MADTIVPVVVINTVSTSLTGIGIVVFGVQTGLDYPTLFMAVLGSALGVSYLKPANIYKRMFETATATGFAAYSAPLLVHILLHYLVKFDFAAPGIEPSIALSSVCAFIVGYLAHSTILPGLRKIGTSFFRRTAND
jgi:hypothetical protein